MNVKEIEIDSETSRIRAALVNTGEHTFEEAEKKLAASRLAIVIGEEAALTPAGQAAFLTAIVTAARCFGEVTVHGHLDAALCLPLPLKAKNLFQAAFLLGASQPGGLPAYPRILIGSGLEPGDGWSVQARWNGWNAGVAPGRQPAAVGRGDCPLAGVAAGALAVGQAFLAEQGDFRAGRMRQDISLWTPELGSAGVLQPGPGSNEVYLPTALWLIGMGNLGQANLWSLTMLPYPKASDVLLFFQDDQSVGPENWGTSILVERGKYGILKTRVAEDWSLARGFQARRIDRRLDTNLFRADIEPGIALAGLDRMPARRLLGHRGFDYIIDSGLGATVSDYRKFRINVFDSASNPAEHFEGVDDQAMETARELLELPTYQEVARNRGDSGCGAATLAGIPVAVPFVSAFAAALAVTQAIRIASGEPHHVALTGDSADLRSIRGAVGKRPTRLIIPGVLAAA